MPTSNDTRVRSEGFSKIIASVLPLSAPLKRAGSALISRASESRWRSSSEVKSRMVRKSGTRMTLPRIRVFAM
jgi:hypothetical protein